LPLFFGNDCLAANFACLDRARFYQVIKLASADVVSIAESADGISVLGVFCHVVVYSCTRTVNKKET